MQSLTQFSTPSEFSLTCLLLTFLRRKALKRVERIECFPNQPYRQNLVV